MLAIRPPAVPKQEMLAKLPPCTPRKPVASRLMRRRIGKMLSTTMSVRPSLPLPPFVSPPCRHLSPMPFSQLLSACHLALAAPTPHSLSCGE